MHRKIIITGWIFALLAPLIIPTTSHSTPVVDGQVYAEGNYGGDCHVFFCSISSLDTANCNWTGETDLPNGHYYWLGVVSLFECVDGVWQKICQTPGWYFNYKPADDTGIIAGTPCDSTQPPCEQENNQWIANNCQGNPGSYDCQTDTGKCEPPSCDSTLDNDNDGLNQCQDCDDSNTTLTVQCQERDKSDKRYGCPGQK